MAQLQLQISYATKVNMIMTEKNRVLPEIHLYIFYMFIYDNP